MKPFSGIDVTNDKKNEQMNLDDFLVFKPSEHLSQSLEEYSEDAIDVVFEKVKLPFIIRALQWVCGLVIACGIIAISEILFEEDTPSIKEMYAKWPWLFWVFALCVVVWGIITFVAHKKQKEVLQSDERDRLFSGMDTVAQSIYDEMGLSGDEKSVDILSFEYKLKDGEYNRVVALKEYKIVSYDIEEALAMKKEIDPYFLHVSDIISI